MTKIAAVYRQRIEDLFVAYDRLVGAGYIELLNKEAFNHAVSYCRRREAEELGGTHEDS